MIRRSGLLIAVLATLLIAGVATLLIAGVATAQQPGEPVTADEVNAIAKELYCPVCENIPLDACGTAACADWRYEIQLQLEAGSTPDEIKVDFVRRFGDRVVAVPYDPTLRAMSVVTPFLVMAVGLFLVVSTFRRSRQRVALHRLDEISHDSAQEMSASDRLRQQIERDITR